MPLLLVIIAGVLTSGLASVGGMLGGGGEVGVAPGAGGIEEPSCRAAVEAGVTARVDVFPEKEYFSDGTTPLYIDKEGKEWILIKRGAGVPAWKIGGGAVNCRFDNQPGRQIPAGIPREQWAAYCRANGGTILRETERIGATVGEGRDVYVGLGHCNGDPGVACVDPLVQNSLFVLERAGASWAELSKNGVCAPWPKAKSRECSGLPGFWWDFSFYLAREAFADPGNPTYAGLPCWAKLACTGNTAVDGKDKRRQAMEEYRRTGVCPVGGAGARPTEPVRYMPREALEVGGSTLKLATFGFETRRFAYEWWTPACKPAIYLYPEETREVRVRVEPEGELTKAIPEYPEEGWEVVAEPDGRLREYRSDRSYNYLFYEAEIEKLRVPERGWVVGGEELGEFFGEVLGRLGLSGREIGDFREYWEPKLEDEGRRTEDGNGEWWFVGLVEGEELERVEKVEIEPEPDTFIRVRFIFEKLNAPFSIEPPVLAEKLEREGFVAVDWGGVLLGGSCEEGVATNQRVR